MRKSGFLIRFIDVGLIILFGFLMISDIEMFSQVTLPGAEAPAADEEPEETALVAVHIDREGRLTVSDLDEDGAAQPIASLAALEERLGSMASRHRTAGRRMVVVIDPHEDSAIQRTVDVMDVCDRSGIPKSINVEALRL